MEHGHAKGIDISEYDDAENRLRLCKIFGIDPGRDRSGCSIFNVPWILAGGGYESEFTSEEIDELRRGAW